MMPIKKKLKTDTTHIDHAAVARIDKTLTADQRVLTPPEVESRRYHLV